MLSYQHQYHAGNYADVLKHWVLFECVRHLQLKAKPFDYIDTHAGLGIYDLRSAAAQKLSEHERGIIKLLQYPIEGMRDWLHLIENFIAQQQYPGSPTLVNQLLRAGQRSWLYELHPQTFAALKQQYSQRGQTQVAQEDGFNALIAKLPVASRRALVLIDPSYEIKTDYQRVVEVLEAAYRKMPQTILLLWYPVVVRERIMQLEKKLLHSQLRAVDLYEINVCPDGSRAGMTGAGMLVVNPPWTLKNKVDAVLPALTQLLAEDACGHYRSMQLIAE